VLNSQLLLFANSKEFDKGNTAETWVSSATSHQDAQCIFGVLANNVPNGHGPTCSSKADALLRGRHTLRGS
jgi:hypothetical protein